jgi:Tol biopolymer transport system component
LRVLQVASGAVLDLPTELQRFPSRPHWSPDGTQLSFEDFTDFEEHVYLVAADGQSPPRRLALVGEERSAAWSPDGSRLAFIGDAQSGSGERVYVTDRNGSDPRPISPAGLEPEFSGHDLDWSPDGSRIVFTAPQPRGPEFGTDLYLVGADGNGFMNLTVSSPFSSNERPHWSPDGRLIAYFCSDVDRDGTVGDICTIPPEGGARTNLTHRLDFYFDFGWSPDGSRIVFARSGSDEDIFEDLFIVNADGSGLVRLTRTGAAEFSPSWAP